MGMLLKPYTQFIHPPQGCQCEQNKMRVAQVRLLAAGFRLQACWVEEGMGLGWADCYAATGTHTNEPTNALAAAGRSGCRRAVAARQPDSAH